MVFNVDFSVCRRNLENSSVSSSVHDTVIARGSPP